MSSSDSEEFYDASDVTPHRDRSQPFSKNEKALSMEEQKLLEAKQIVEMRRKLEDAAIEERLNAIHAQEEEEQAKQTQQLAYQEDADVNLQRRKKLEEMRLKLNDGDVSSSSDSQPQLSQHETIRRSISRENLTLRKSMESKAIDQSSQGELEEMEKVEFSVEGRVMEHSEQVGDIEAKEPDLIQSVKSSSLGRNASPLNTDDKSSNTSGDSAGLIETGVPTVTVHTPDDEVVDDDAVQMPPPPLAPPRRKKKTPSVAHSEQQDTANISTKIARVRPTTISDGKHQLSAPSNTSRPQTVGEILLTAPSPMVARRPLNLSDLRLAEDQVVTAQEEENTRAINDIHKSDIASIYDTESLTGSVNMQQTTITEDSEEISDSKPDAVNPVSKRIAEQTEGGISTAVAAELVAVASGVVRSPTESKSASFPRGQRPLSGHGAGLTEHQQAVLDTMSVLNLDTGERIPLSVAEEKLPASINPLSLHIMRRTKEYLSDTSINKQSQSSTEKPAGEKEAGGVTVTTVKGLNKGGKKKLKSLLGKAKNKLKSVKDEVFHNTDSSTSEEEEDEERRLIKVKASKTHKGPYDFDLLVPVQYLDNAHNSAVWTMKFSQCGRLLATGSQDGLLKVWVLKHSYAYFNEMRSKYNQDQKKKVSPAQSEESVNETEVKSGLENEEADMFSPFCKHPFFTYKGHTADILDVSWSKNYFILTSSMDKTVRLWHVSRKECLCCFQHIDFVTAIAFHPKDDRYFVSGSLDGKLRLWSIPERKVELWNEVSGSTKLITAANFCMKGKFAVVGTYDGRCVFYSTEQLKYYTQIHVRSTRGKNSKGRKITGVEPLPGEDKILVTSNDSRVRLYDLRDLTLTCKYRGCANNSSQIKAGFSHDGRFIACGSEDQFVYIWRTQHEFHTFSSARRDRSDYWEAIKAHNAVVTAAIFAPKPNLVIRNQFEYLDSDDKQSTPQSRGEVLISADYNGTIKCFINKFKPGAS